MDVLIQNKYVNSKFVFKNIDSLEKCFVMFVLWSEWGEVIEYFNRKESHGSCEPVVKLWRCKEAAGQTLLSSAIDYIHSSKQICIDSQW